MMPNQTRLFSLLTLCAATLAAAATMAAPDAAQASPGGFTLPTGTPTPTSRPEVEGPADDTGAAPLAPRVIPTGTPSPQPTTTATVPTPAPSIAPVLRPSDTASPAQTTTPRPAQSGPVQSRQADRPAAQPSNAGANAPTGAATTPAPTAAASAPDTGGTPGLDTSGGLPDPAIPEASETPATDGASSDTEAAIPFWAWIVGGLALLGLLIGGALFLRRRAETVSVPTIEPPKVAPRPATDPAPAPAPAEPSAIPAPQAAPAMAAATETVLAPAAPASAPARIDLEIEIVRATRSVMNFTIDYRLNLANRTPNAVRDVSVSAILTCAQNATVPADGTLGFDRPEPLLIPRIGPNKTHAESGQVQLPTNKLQVMRQGNTPLFVPLLQITVTQGDGEPVTRHFVVGQPSTANAARLQPLPLNTPPGGIPGLRVRELDIQPA